MAEARALAVSVQTIDVGASPPLTKLQVLPIIRHQKRSSAGVGGARDSGHLARDTLAPRTPHSFLHALYSSMTPAFVSNPIFIFSTWMGSEAEAEVYPWKQVCGGRSSGAHTSTAQLWHS
jgi:hypothetical protein